MQEDFAQLSHNLIEQCLNEEQLHHLCEKPSLLETLDVLEPLIDWESLAHHLPRITGSDISEIKVTQTDSRSQKSALVSKWLQTKDASWKQLMVALVKCVNTVTVKFHSSVNITQSSTKGKKMMKLLF